MADFHYLAQRINILEILDTTLFEAYPGATLAPTIGSDFKEYKGDNATAAGAHELQKSIGIKDPMTAMNDDQIDALICTVDRIPRFQTYDRRKLVKGMAKM